MNEIAKEGFSFSNVRSMLAKIPFSTVTVGGLYLVILIVGVVNGFGLTTLLSNSLHLFGVWAIFALANVPSIQSGTGPNFALPVGIVMGLLAMVLMMALSLTGFVLLAVSAVVAIIFGAMAGFLYGKLMNAVKGSEMAIAPYTGFALTSIFSLVWFTIPITHPGMGMFLGDGLRQMIALDQFGADRLLARLMYFELFGLEVRTGELLVVFVACALMWLFFRSKTGIAISAVGRNPMFAKAAGINVGRSRVVANMISTAVAALGVVVYAQGFGFVQLYDFPLLMAFPAVASILVGGATGQRAKVSNVIIGTLLFQGLIATALPVLTRVLAGTDVDQVINGVRMIIQNGIILYALSRMSRGGR